MNSIRGGRGIRRRRPLRRVAALLTLIVMTLSVSACGISIPTDPDGTLDSVTGSTMHVGISPEPGLVEIDDAGPSGPLVTLAEGFAASIDARIEWTVAAEESLVEDLETGNLDLAVGGFTDRTPWTDRAGITRGYTGITGAGDRSLVFLVPLGENAFLTKLEEFLDEEVGP